MQPVSHSEHVLQQLCSQLEYGFLCDCSITVGDVHFRAHRVVLAACSSYFHKLFVNRPAEASQVVLSSQAVSPDHFDLILQLMYTGSLVSSPADPERFSASLNFLKLYNAACFPGPAAQRERQSQEGARPDPDKNDPLQFGVELRQDKCSPVETEAPPAPQHCRGPVSVKAESPEGALESQALLCHHCGLAFAGQQGLSEHLQLHAEKPFSCPLCGLAFECTQRLPAHVASCLRRRQEAEESLRRETEDRWTLAPEVKREAEPPERLGGDGGPDCCGAAAYEDPGLAKPKVEDPTEEQGQEQIPSSPLVLELSGLTVVRVGGEREACGEREVCALPPQPFEQAEDYELEEGEVRFPGDDDLVLENASDGSLFSSSDSSLDSESSGLTELSGDEGPPSGAGPTAFPAPPTTGPPDYHTCDVFGTEERQASRRRSKARRCQACDGCRPSEKAAGGQPGVGGGAGQKKAALRRWMPECSGRNGACPERGQRPGLQGPGWERRAQGALSGRAKVPASGGAGKKGAEAAPGKLLRTPNPKKGAKAAEGKQRHPGKKAAPPPAASRKRSRHLKHFCEVCGKRFAKQSRLANHTATHRKQLTCQVCGQEFPWERDLRHHLAQHTNEARYECRLCGHRNYRKHSHLRHMTCHLTPGQALCQICFEILQSEDLERHMESHHHLCEGCGEKFKLKRDLVKHSTSCWSKRLLDSELDKVSECAKHQD
ncbi:uncharacterized protein LOC144511402 [Mustelus asterias]